MEDTQKILKLILGIESVEGRLSTLQLALQQARKLIGIDDLEGEKKINYQIFQCRRPSQDSIANDIIDYAFKAHQEEEMDIFASLSLYLIVLDQLGHIFGGRCNKSVRIREAIKKSKTSISFSEEELDAITRLRHSLNHNFGLANYNPTDNKGNIKFEIIMEKNEHLKFVVCPSPPWSGNWCDKSESSSTKLYAFSFINYLENEVLKSFVEQVRNETISTHLCVEELKTRFTGASGFFRGRPPQTMHDCISKSIDLYVCQKCCTFAPYFIKV